MIHLRWQRCSFWNIYSLCHSKMSVNIWFIWENIFCFWNVETIILEFLFCSSAELPFCGACVFVWQKRPAGFRTAGMAMIRAQNVSRWSRQKRKQQKICLVTELHWRAGKPPEAPTEPPACYPFPCMPFLHLFFIIMSSLISFFHRLQSIPSYTQKKITLNYHNLPAIRTEHWYKGQWPWRGDPEGGGRCGTCYSRDLKAIFPLHINSDWNGSLGYAE